MSWKPCRSSGVMFDRYDRKANENKKKLDELLPQCNPPKFEDINRLSKFFYLYWLNEEKKRETLGVKGHRYNFSNYCPSYYIRIFQTHSQLIYKPLLKYIQNV